MTSISDIKKLRELTGAGVSDCRQALEECGGDFEKAKKFLFNKGAQRAEKRKEREAGEGLVFSYLHTNSKMAALVKLYCETSFVAKTDEFLKLGREVAMQISAMNPSSLEDLMEQDYIRESGKKVKDLVTEVAGKTGEKIAIGDFVRYEV